MQSELPERNFSATELLSSVANLKDGQVRANENQANYLARKKHDILVAK